VSASDASGEAWGIHKHLKTHFFLFVVSTCRVTFGDRINAQVSLSNFYLSTYFVSKGKRHNNTLEAKRLYKVWQEASLRMLRAHHDRQVCLAELYKSSTVLQIQYCKEWTYTAGTTSASYEMPYRGSSRYVYATRPPTACVEAERQCAVYANTRSIFHRERRTCARCLFVSFFFISETGCTEFSTDCYDSCI